MDGTKVKRELERLYRQYHNAERLENDPLGLVSRHLAPPDFELVSYITASLAYGRVEQIRKSLTELWLRLEKLGLRPGGENLHAYFVDNPGTTLHKDLRKVLRGWVHRFNDEEDMRVLLLVLQRIAQDGKSLGDLYAAHPSTLPTEKLQYFVASLRSYARPAEQEHFSWFACSPAEGSTCKRMVMWLRWMLRADEVDPGLWTQNPNLSAQGVGPHLAFIPMDTHIHRWATQNNLLSRKNPSWKSVEELTAFLRTVDPQDPARFDFCIFQHGMSQFRSSSLQSKEN